MTRIGHQVRARHRAVRLPRGTIGDARPAVAKRHRDGTRACRIDAAAPPAVRRRRRGRFATVRGVSIAIAPPIGADDSAHSSRAHGRAVRRARTTPPARAAVVDVGRDVGLAAIRIVRVAVFEIGVAVDGAAFHPARRSSIRRGGAHGFARVAVHRVVRIRAPRIGTHEERRRATAVAHSSVGAAHVWTGVAQRLMADRTSVHADAGAGEGHGRDERRQRWREHDAGSRRRKHRRLWSPRRRIRARDGVVGMHGGPLLMPPRPPGTDVGVSRTSAARIGRRPSLGTDR